MGAVAPEAGQGNGGRVMEEFKSVVWQTRFCFSDPVGRRFTPEVETRCGIIFLLVVRMFPGFVLHHVSLHWITMAYIKLGEVQHRTLNWHVLDRRTYDSFLDVVLHTYLRVF
jgi:hypothetical protein